MSDPQEAATPSDPHSAEALDLDAIEKRAGAATGTRYGMSATDATGTILWATADDQPFVHLGEIFPETSQGDIDFLLHARTDVPTLVAVVRLRDAEVAELKAKIADAVARLNAASIPPMMTEAQFNATTITDARRILLGSASSPVEGGN